MENYLLKLRYANDMKSKNNTDFGYLTQYKKGNKKKRIERPASDSENSSI